MLTKDEVEERLADPFDDEEREALETALALWEVAEAAKKLMLSTPPDHSGDALCAALAALEHEK